MAMASLSCRCSLGASRIGVLKIQRPTRRRTRSWVFVNGVGRKTSCAIENWWMYGHFFSRPRLIQLPSAATQAWALLYAEEKAVRPILSIDIMVHRDCALLAMQELQSAGWILEPRMPRPEGRALDRFEGV